MLGPSFLLIDDLSEQPKLICYSCLLQGGRIAKRHLSCYPLDPVRRGKWWIVSLMLDVAR